MFGLLFFIPTAVFLVLALIFPLAIVNVDKIPKAITLNIGNLNTNDICKMDSDKRAYLRNQVVFYFALAVATTFLVGVLFIVFGSAENAWLVLLCDLIGTVTGLAVALQVLKKANALK